MSDSGALYEAYQDLIEIERGPVGVRYSAALEDGTPVVALAVDAAVVRQIASVEGFVDAFERAAAVHHESLVPPLAWGQLRDGTLHCAYARFDTKVFAPSFTTSSTNARIGAQLARGLAAAHQAGIVHGAVSPRAVAVVEGRGAMLGELGLYTALRAGGVASQTAVMLLSDRACVAPEVLRGEDPSQSSDVYSLASALHGLLTGDAAQTPPALVDVLKRAMESAEENRWPSATAFAQALAAAEAPIERSGEMKSRRGCLSAAVGATTVVAAIATVVAFG